MPEENIVSAITNEASERVDHAAEAAKLVGSSAAAVPGEVADIAAEFLGGAGSVAGDAVEDVVDAVAKKIKDGLKVLEALGGIVTGD